MYNVNSRRLHLKFVKEQDVHDQTHEAKSGSSEEAKDLTVNEPSIVIPTRLFFLAFETVSQNYNVLKLWLQKRRQQRLLPPEY